jgi:hypothetical protein
MAYFRIDFSDLVHGWPQGKAAKKIFNRALRRHNREVNGPLGKEEDDDPADTELGNQPGGEQGAPPLGDYGYGSMD